MSPLTLQEVIDRINQVHSTAKNPQTHDDHAIAQKHRPEFSIPYIARRLARFILSTGTSAGPGVA
jgi:hypothetical protein